MYNTGSIFTPLLLTSSRKYAHPESILSGISARRATLPKEQAMKDIDVALDELQVPLMIGDKIFEKAVRLYQTFKLDATTIVMKLKTQALNEYSFWLEYSKAYIFKFDPKFNEIIHWLDLVDNLVPNFHKSLFIINHLSDEARSLLELKVVNPINTTNGLKKELIRVFGLDQHILDRVNKSLVYLHEYTVASFNNLFNTLLPYRGIKKENHSAYYIRNFRNYPRVQAKLDSNKPLLELYTTAIKCMDVEIIKHDYTQTPLEPFNMRSDDQIDYFKKYFPIPDDFKFTRRFSVKYIKKPYDKLKS